MNRLLETLSGTKTDRPPIWFMRQAGRYLPEYRKVRADLKDFLELCYTPEKACEVTLQPIKRFGFDAAIIFSDILVIPHAMGMKLEYLEGEGPHLSGFDISKARMDEGMLSPVYEAISLTRSELSKETALIGFAGAPWTLACYMIDGKGGGGFPKAKAYVQGKEKEFSILMNNLVEAVVKHLSNQIKAGAEVVQLFDSWAGLHAQDKDAFAQWVIEPAKKIVSKLRQLHPATPIIGFPRQAGEYYRAYAAHTGVDAIGLDQSVDPAWAVKNIDPKVVLQGNLDPEALADDIEAAKKSVNNILGTWKDRRSIFNLGHGILPRTPITHVETILELVRKHG